MAEFNQSWIELVPRVPPGVSDDPRFQDGLRRLEARGQGYLGKVLYWTNQFGVALVGLDEILRGIRFVARLSAGFIEELDGEFGIIVYTERHEEAEDGSDDQALDSSLRLSIDNRSFPIIIRESYVERHWCTSPEVTTPTGARATCWVLSRGYGGWLIPRHAINPFGANVTFSDGGRGRVVDHFGECIDAAVVSSTVEPQGLSKKRASWPIVAGQPLLVTDAPGSHVDVSVIDVDLNLGVLRSDFFPIRFSTDWGGKPGQSGALIVEPLLGEPAGSYLGILRPRNQSYIPKGATTTPTVTGYAQSCFQLENIAGMEFFL